MELIDELEDAYTLREAAQKLRITFQRLHHWVKDGKIESVKMPGQRLITRRAMNDFLQARLTPVQQEKPTRKPGRRSEAQRKADSARAAERAKALGC